MKTTNNKALLLATFSFLFPFSAAIADDNSDSKPQFSVGLKAWNASWGSAMQTVYSVITPTGGFQLGESADVADASHKTSVIPSFAVRKDKFIASASHARYSSDFFAPNTSVIAPNGMNVSTWRSDHVKRRESDITAGYYVTPNVAISLGYKHVNEGHITTVGVAGGTFPNYDIKARALLLGAAATFSITDRLYMSNQVAYGPARTKIMIPDGSLKDITVDSSYMIYDVGLNYALQTGNERSILIGIGYRSQLVRTDGIGAANRNSRRFRDSREGFLLSMTVAI